MPSNLASYTWTRSWKKAKTVRVCLYSVCVCEYIAFIHMNYKKKHTFQIYDHVTYILHSTHIPGSSLLKRYKPLHISRYSAVSYVYLRQVPNTHMRKFEIF